MNDKTKKTDNALFSGEFICGECGSKRVKTTWQSYKFPYGVGTDAVELSCEVPVRNCEDCDFTFIDIEAEYLCHEAICKHLGVMTPKKIKSLRELYKLTQAQFCEITKLGEATLSRWERGILVQNSAYDNYLYLLGFRENIDKLLNRREGSKLPALDIEKLWPTFRAIKEITPELIERQNRFELQPCP